jgi:hypothetical protein
MTRPTSARPWIEIAARAGGFSLVERETTGASPWRNLKVILRHDGTGKRKRKWWLAWSTAEQRLSRSSDAVALAERHPEIAEWVIETLRRVPDQTATEERTAK